MTDPLECFELVRLLDECAEPYHVTETMLADLLGHACELHREISAVLDAMEHRARMEKTGWPEAVAAEVRQEIAVLGKLREHLELDSLLGVETRERCGRHAVPALALALYQVWSRVQMSDEWLDVLPARFLLASRLQRPPRDRGISPEAREEDAPEEGSEVGAIEPSMASDLRTGLAQS